MNRTAILDFEVENVDREFERLKDIVKDWVFKPKDQPRGQPRDALPRPRWQPGQRLHGRRGCSGHVREIGLGSAPFRGTGDLLLFGRVGKGPDELGEVVLEFLQVLLAQCPGGRGIKLLPDLEAGLAERNAALGQPDHFGPRIGRVRDLLDVPALFEQAHKLAHGLFGYAGSLREQRGAHAGRVEHGHDAGKRRRQVLEAPRAQAAHHGGELGARSLHDDGRDVGCFNFTAHECAVDDPLPVEAPK